jgi:hypothetical protein
VPIVARGKVVSVGDHLILRDPELPRELVDLSLEWGDARLKLVQLCLSRLAGNASLVGIVFDDLIEPQSMDGLFVPTAIRV